MTTAPAASVSARKWVYETKGQYFIEFLFRRHIDSERSMRLLPLSLLSTSRGTEWSDAFHEMAVLHLGRRLISAAAAIAKRSAVWDYAVERDMKQMVLDTMTIDYTEVPEIYERLAPAVRASSHGIPDGVRNQMRAEARREMPWCYLCGAELDFDTIDDPISFTLDHVWPQSHGGDSDRENLLQCCKSCNGRKDEYASWTLFPIQALVAGYQLDVSEFEQRVSKEMRFAVLSRAAVARSRSEEISLKEAFVAMGRPDLPRVLDTSTSIDVFNLTPQYR